MHEAIAGVYRIYAANGASFVGFSRNINGTLKRLKFELTLNACSFKSLQRLWNESGPLELEMLEEIKCEGMDDIELDARLNACMLKWQKALGENTRLVQTAVEA
jgi:hypothetical protein